MHKLFIKLSNNQGFLNKLFCDNMDYNKLNKYNLYYFKKLKKYFFEDY